MQTNERLRIGLVGCGGFGPELGIYFRDNPRCALTALCDPDTAAMDRCGERLGLSVPRFRTSEEMLEKGALDAVVICSPNHTHAPIAVAAAEAGKHVFCEKAMATNTRDCWRMVRAAQENDVRLMVGHKRRLRPPWARMIELVRSGVLGTPVAINVTGFHEDTYAFGWWKEREKVGGLFQLAGVHPIDWMRGVCGDAEQVSAVAGPQQDGTFDYPDLMAATIRFRSGAIATIQAALGYPLWTFREAFGPQIVCANGGIRLLPHMDHIDLEYRRRGEEYVERFRFDDLGFDHAYSLETGDFIAWVLDGKSPCLTWEEGLRCVEIMEAAYRSAEQGGRPVELPLYPELEDPIS